MTGDIRTKLASSEAAESLRMESFIAGCFRSHRWPAEQGIYYTDTATGKAREIDVISRHVLQRPKRNRGVGAPLINISIICECKSLSGWNVILLERELERFYEDRIMDHWSGHEEYIRDLIEFISKDSIYKNLDRNLLYSYYLSRAYPDDRQLAYHLRLLQPSVELIAAAFRATKGGADEMQKSEERGTVNPFWSAIQSVLSATKAAELRAVKMTKSYTRDRESYAFETSKLINHDTFFFDSELTRRVFFHPVIFCKSNLFRLNKDLESVNSARIFVRDLDFEFRYVDVVNLHVAEDYINVMLTDLEKQSYKAIRKTWDRLEDLAWQPGQASNQFSEAVGLSRRPRARTPKKPLS